MNATATAANLTTPAKGLGARAIANRIAKRAKDEARFAPVAAAMFAKGEITYYQDAKGNKVRDTTEVKVTNEEIAFFLTGNRVVDRSETLEALGKEVLAYMIQKDYLRQSDPKCPSILWVTLAAAENYNLRRPVIMGLKMNFPA